MRYRTVGDWIIDKWGSLVIQVADAGDWRFNLLVAVHELIEVFLCVHDGVTQAAVDAFDLSHQEDEDPGCHPLAPYHRQHMIAMGVEMVLAAVLGVKWRKYEAALEVAWGRTPIGGKDA